MHMQLDDVRDDVGTGYIQLMLLSDKSITLLPDKLLVPDVLHLT